MDEYDIKIKSLLDKISNESVPYGFEEKVMRKISMETVKRRERKENVTQIMIATFFVILFVAIMIYLNLNFFKLDFSNYRINIPEFDFKIKHFSLMPLFNSASVKGFLSGPI